ncbi:NACHT domain-containing protein [Actinokineospora sp. 24-640]
MPGAQVPIGVPLGRFLYERLQEKGFQRLCNALLAHLFPDTVCMPVGHRDGGRDALRRTEGGLIVYQVKWSANPVRNPAAWLDAAIREESVNIARLVNEGATEYILITSVPGTAVPRQGGIDQLQARLEEHGRRLGVRMACWWRHDLDARLEAAPQQLLWAYADMLAGHDLIGYLLRAPERAEHEEQLRELLLKVVAAQWEQDARVKFKQVDLDTHALEDLFVDVGAERVAVPINRSARFSLEEKASLLGEVGGAAAYLLDEDRTRATFPMTLVLGAPGQGKSTLAQYVCQAHREKLLAETGRGDAADASDRARRRMDGVQQPRVPLRIDLRDYAGWLRGYNPFAAESPDARRPQPRRARSVEMFLVDWLHALSGGRAVDVATVHEIVDRFPLLLVFDGLDEIAQIEVRARVVSEIEKVSARLRSCRWPARVVVTARPSAAALPEPSGATFETLALMPLGAQLREEYLDRWAAARGLSAADRAALARIFRARSAQPHIAQLSENPMQLTILLHLIQKRGESIPDARTELYESFMETFLDREAGKTPAVARHRKDLEEVTAHLGWYLQSRAESANGDGRLSVRRLKVAIADYLIGVGKDAGMVEELFTAVTDRVWALTSKQQGSFEFDVQPVQEYFAAKHAYQVAGSGQRLFDSSQVFAEMVRRPYWANVCRFYAGCCKVSELPALAAVLTDEFTDTADTVGSPPGHLRTLTWQLLADGVFTPRPHSRAAVAALLADDLSTHLLLHDVSQGAAPKLAVERGATDLTRVHCAMITQAPERPMHLLRTQLLAAAHSGNAVDTADITEFDTWWQQHLADAAGTDHEASWLRLGIAHAAGTRLPAELSERLTLRDPDAAAAALDAGVAIPESSPATAALLRAVLDGHCSDSSDGRDAGDTVLAPGEAADLLRVAAPARFLGLASTSTTRDVIMVWPHDGLPSVLAASRPRPITAVMDRLVHRDSRYEALRRARRVGKGQKGTTSVWGNTARALAAIHGPSLLATEIAVIGAAASTEDFVTGGDITPGAPAFGPRADYGQMIEQTRRRRSDTAWWREHASALTEPLDRAAWALALLGVAHVDVVADCLDLLEDTMTGLPALLGRAMLQANSRLGYAGVARALPSALLHEHAATLDPTTALALAHHSTSGGTHADALLQAPDAAVIAMIDTGAANWPAVSSLRRRALTHTDLAQIIAALRACGPLPFSDEFLEPEVDDAVAHLGLAHCSDISDDWVLVCTAAVSAKRTHPPLATIADKLDWFP